MNYAHFAEFLRHVEDELVQRFDVSRADARKIAERMDLDIMRASTQTREARQLVIDYKEHGPAVLAERMGVCRETVRKKYVEALNNESPTEIAA